MPATRSQKAALASPLTTTTRKRSVSRAPSAEPPARKAPSRAASRKTSPAAAETTAITTTTTKRKSVAEGAAEEEAQESPRKRVRTLRDIEFKERIAKRVEEHRAAREQQAPEAPAQATTPKGPYSYLPTYPSPSQQPHKYEPYIPQTAPQSDRQYSWWKPPSEVLQPPTTPTQMPAPPQQVAQTQPQQRGWMSRILDVVTPWKNPTKTPSSAGAHLPEARVHLIQLQKHAELQKQLNSEINHAVAIEEQRLRTAAPHHEYEAEQEHTLPGDKRKRTAANEVTGLPPLNDISESPEARFTDNMQTPSRPRTHNGLVPKSLPRPRRTYKDARAAAANKGMRNATDPPTPAVSRTAPSTPYDKNDYTRIRRLREIEELGAQHNAMKAKLDKLRAEQAAEAATQPRKTKRVKIEHLKEIPHNLPGEPSGSFRFPEADSDDEMEVDEDVEVIENPFTAADDEEPEERQVSPAKTPASNPFTTKPATTMFQTPALKAASPVKRAVSPVRKAPSPVKKAPSPMKAASPVQEVEEIVEVEDTVIEASPTASPEPTQVFSEASDDESDIDDEDWPELPQRKADEPEPPQWWKAEALAKFNKEFEHWEATGEILA